MKVEVVVFGVLRDHLPEGATGNRAVADVPEGASVEDAISALGLPRRAVYAVLVDGDPADAAVVLREGAEVTLMPAFTGGARS